MNDFITYRDECFETETLIPVVNINTAVYENKAELKSKKQKPEIAAQINLEHLREFFMDVAIFANEFLFHIKNNDELRGTLRDLNQSAIQLAEEIGQIQDRGE